MGGIDQTLEVRKKSTMRTGLRPKVFFEEVPQIGIVKNVSEP